MAEREIGVGVIGFGLGGRVFHAPFVNAVQGLRLVAIMQRKGDEAAKAWPATKTARSFEELLADKSIELVVVSTPNETHFALARQALEAGKHVVIDKPFAATSEEALELGRIAKAKGLLVIPFHNRRWDGDFLTVKKMLAERAVGRLVTFESHFDRFRPIPRENTWKEAENPANGMLFDLGPHLVDQALAVMASGATRRPSRTPSTSRCIIQARTARVCWRTAAPATWPATTRRDFCCTEPRAASANTASTRRSPRWWAARAFPRWDRSRCGCRRTNRRGAR